MTITKKALKEKYIFDLKKFLRNYLNFIIKMPEYNGNID